MHGTSGGRFLARELHATAEEQPAQEFVELELVPPGPLIERLSPDSLAAVAKWYEISVIELIARFSHEEHHDG